jgi:hypothetical protein
MERRRKLQRGASWGVLRTKYHSGDQIKEDEMGGACGTHGQEYYIESLCKKSWRKEDTWKD